MKKTKINNFEQITGQCYLTMHTHFLNKKGTETTSSNKMFLGVVHQQREGVISYDIKIKNL